MFKKPTQASLLAEGARQKSEGDRDRAAQRAADDKGNARGSDQRTIPASWAKRTSAKA